MDRYIGRCGNCGGSVTVPSTWYGMQTPKPHCVACGSTPRDTGPVIEMNPKPHTIPWPNTQSPAIPATHRWAGDPSHVMTSARFLADFESKFDVR